MSTTKSITTLAIAALGLLALGLGEAAFAKQGRGRGRGRGGSTKAERIKEKLRLEIVDTTDVAPRKARLRIRRKSTSRQELRIQLGDAAPNAGLDVWFEDAAGVMTRVGALRESDDDRGDYDWRVRTKKGQGLPFGVSDVADLSGRDVEVRSAAGVVARGAMPNLAPAAVRAGKRAEVRSPLSTGAEVTGDDDLVDDDLTDGVEAEIRLRRKKDREELKVEVEGVATGADLSVWIADDAGALTRVGDLVEQADDDGVEYELTLRTDRDVLPFGLDSVAGLSDREVEIRDAAGDVVAAGFVPRLGEDGATGRDDDDDDADEDVDDDVDEDEDEDDDDADDDADEDEDEDEDEGDDDDSETEDETEND